MQMVEGKLYGTEASGEIKCPSYHPITHESTNQPANTLTI